MKQKQTLKKPISMKFSPATLELLEQVSKINDFYFQRNRTWLVEYAIEQQYRPLVNDSAEDNGNS